MSFKDLFFINEDKEKKETSKKATSQFPSDTKTPILDEVGVFSTGRS